jgi:hypothetical protein
VNLLRRHLPAAFGTFAAGLDASVHIAKALAFGGAIRADIGAFSAEMLVVRRTDQHHMRGGAACFGAG